MPSLQFKFSVPKLGAAHTWSMKWHFAGGTPADATAWSTLALAVWDELKPGLADDVFWLAAVGYDQDEVKPIVAAWSEVRDGTEHGTYSPAIADNRAPSFCAGLLRWTTDQRNSRGGPIGLRNFVHGVFTEGTTVPDVLAGGQQEALDAFAAQWDASGSGFSDGTNAYHRAGPNGAVGQVGTCSPDIARRVLARRG